MMNEKHDKGIILLRIIAGEGDEAPEGQRQREEDLCGGVQPHFRILQRFPLQ